MYKNIVVDPAKCTGCRICEVACSFEHTQACHPAQSRIKIIKDEDHGIAIPILCAHCTDAPCQLACPLDIISRDPVTGIVSRQEGACIGCRACMIACPYGAISLDTMRGIMIHCDVCEGDPACVKYCPTEALTYVRTDMADMPRRRLMASMIGESVVAARES